GRIQSRPLHPVHQKALPWLAAAAAVAAGDADADVVDALLVAPLPADPAIDRLRIDLAAARLALLAPLAADLRALPLPGPDVCGAADRGPALAAFRELLDERELRFGAWWAEVEGIVADAADIAGPVAIRALTEKRALVEVAAGWLTSACVPTWLSPDEAAAWTQEVAQRAAGERQAADAELRDLLAQLATTAAWDPEAFVAARAALPGVDPADVTLTITGEPGTIARIGDGPMQGVPITTLRLAPEGLTLRFRSTLSDAPEVEIDLASLIGRRTGPVTVRWDGARAVID
ncbi:MAG TPA: hypothetical protein PKA64_09095, partial [Myxococcota bacterium]|nr:hypothetical protein [Myxococcota bacterium]